MLHAVGRRGTTRAGRLVRMMKFTHHTGLVAKNNNNKKKKTSAFSDCFFFVSSQFKMWHKHRKVKCLIRA